MIYHGDLFTVLPTLDAESIDAGVTDPPYGIGFMGREWDTFKPDVPRKQADRLVRGEPIVSDNPNLHGRRRSPAISESQIFYDRTLRGQREFQVWTQRWATEVLRVLKPGAHLLVCGAPRSFHRMTCGLEDAGFIVRDCLSWLYGQGFPKSLNLGEGRGTALKPGWEPIVLARKPFTGSVAANAQAHGTGALNIDACRVDGPPNVGSMVVNNTQLWLMNDDGWSDCEPVIGDGIDADRWPANVVLDDDAAALLDAQTGELQSGDAHILRRGASTGRGMGYGSSAAGNVLDATYGDVGGASRFYYVAKPSREERDFGCDDLPARSGGDATDRVDGSAGTNSPRAGAGRTGGARNIHPTVKPVELMRWLVRLVTPIEGVVLDPFTGSGTTGMACRYEHRRFVGIEREAEYVAIAERRIAAVAPLFAEAQNGDEGTACTTKANEMEFL